MEYNIGSADKKWRFGIGLIALVLGYYYSNWYYLVGAILVLTAWMKFCLLYKVLGLNTYKK